METISYESFVDLFQPIEIGNEMLIFEYTSNQKQRRFILDTPDEFLWVQEKNKLYPHGKNPNEERATHFLVTQLSHQNQLIQVDLSKHPENFKLTKTYKEKEFNQKVTGFPDSSNTTKSSDILNAHIKPDIKSPEIYFKNISRRWKKEIDLAEKIIILSPYITSSTAETVTKNTQGNNCVIYTLFSAELFINQSSSIKTLIKLKKKGIKLYALNGLHAKVVFIPNEFASIGSQNLTTKGTKNKEATVVIKNKSNLDEIERSINEWIKDNYEITLEMLEEMKQLVEPLIDDYKKILQLSKDIDEEIEIARLKRVEDANEDKIIKLKKTISSKKQPYETHLCKIIHNANKDKYGRFSLVSKNDRYLSMWWNIDKQAYEHLKPLNRYLCMQRDTGRFGWAKVADKRITYISNSFSCSIMINLGVYYNCKIRFSCVNDPQELKTSNVKVIISPNLDFEIFCICWFDIDTLILKDIRLVPKNKPLKDLNTWIKSNDEKISSDLSSNSTAKFTYKWIIKNSKTFSDILLKELSSTFRYATGNDTNGINGLDFFGDNLIKLKLIEVNENKILVSKVVS